jgi:hypothetical protein
MSPKGLIFFFCLFLIHRPNKEVCLLLLDSNVQMSLFCEYISQLKLQFNFQQNISFFK